MLSMQKIQQAALWLFIVAVGACTFLAILAIWDVLPEDAWGKAMATIATIGFGALLVWIAARAALPAGKSK